MSIRQASSRWDIWDNPVEALTPREAEIVRSLGISTLRQLAESKLGRCRPRGRAGARALQSLRHRQEQVRKRMGLDNDNGSRISADRGVGARRSGPRKSPSHHAWIDELDFDDSMSVRLRTCLNKTRYKELDDLSRSFEQLRLIEGFGRRCFEELTVLRERYERECGRIGGRGQTVGVSGEVCRDADAEPVRAGEPLDSDGTEEDDDGDFLCLGELFDELVSSDPPAGTAVDSHGEEGETLEDLHNQGRMSVRLYNCLRGEGFHTLGEVPHSAEYLLGIRNFGHTCLRELQRLWERAGTDAAARKATAETQPGEPENDAAERTPEQRDPLLSELHYKRRLSVRSYRRLTSLGYKRLSEVPTDRRRLSAIEGFGRKCYNEIMDLKKKLGTVSPPAVSWEEELDTLSETTKSCPARYLRYPNGALADWIAGKECPTVGELASALPEIADAEEWEREIVQDEIRGLDKSGMDEYLRPYILAEDRVDMHRIFADHQRQLDVRSWTIFSRRCLQGRTLRDVATEVNLTRERVRNLAEKELEEFARNFGRELHLYQQWILDWLESRHGIAAVQSLAQAYGGAEEDHRQMITALGALWGEIALDGDKVISGDLPDRNTEWNAAIKEMLYSVHWPLRLSEMLRQCPAVPEPYVIRYLQKRYQATIDGDRVVEIHKLPVPAMCLYALQEAGRPLKLREIAATVDALFGKKLVMNVVNAQVNRLENALIVDRGTYALYDSLGLGSGRIQEARDRCHGILSEQGGFLKSEMLLSALADNAAELAEPLTQYSLHGVLQDDDRFITKRGLMVGLVENEEAFESLGEMVQAVLREKGPLTVAQVVAEIAPSRPVTAVSVQQAIGSNPGLISIGNGLHTHVANYIDTAELDDLLLACRLCLADGKKTLFTLHRWIQKLNRFDISKAALDSILAGSDDIEVDGREAGLIEPDDRIKQYAKVLQCAEGERSRHRELCLGTFGDDLGIRLLQLDPRVHDHFERPDTTDNGPDELDKLVNAF